MFQNSHHMLEQEKKCLDMKSKHFSVDLHVNILCRGIKLFLMIWVFLWSGVTSTVVKYKNFEATRTLPRSLEVLCRDGTTSINEAFMLEWLDRKHCGKRFSGLMTLNLTLWTELKALCLVKTRGQEERDKSLNPHVQSLYKLTQEDCNCRHRAFKTLLN